MLPDQLGGYRVIEQIGAGGMGEVYRARDTALDRDVAIKILPAAFATDADRIMRFEREAKTLAALNHPHIAQIYGLQRIPGDNAAQALVMEFVDGEDLAARLARGPVPMDDGLAMAAQVAEALEAAHDAGITHRDLKPANIRLRPDGIVKVLDFGLAKPSAHAGAVSGSIEMMHSPTVTSPVQTMQGIILGTATYMSPEQAKGKAVDRRTDIWAFGCVLYELLTGRRPFSGSDVSDIMVSILRDEPEWHALPAGTPPRIRRLLRWCLEKDVRKRLPHIGVARLVLAGGEDEPAEPVRPAAGRWYSHLPWAIGGAAAVLLAAVPFWPRAAPPAAPLRFTVEAPAGGAFVGSSSVPRFAVSPDGAALVYQVVLPNDTAHLLLRRFDTTESRALEGSTSTAGGQRGQQPFWSPGGRDVAFFDEEAGALLKLNLDSGEIRTVVKMTGNQYGGSWGSGDVILFSTVGTGGIRRVAAAGGEPVQVTTVDPADPNERHLWPEILPDGRHFLFFRLSQATTVRTMTEGRSGDVYIASLDGGTPKRLLASPAMARFAAPDRLLFVRDGSLFAQRLDLDRLELTGTPELIVNEVHYTQMGRLGASASHTGMLVYSAGGVALAGGEAIWVDRAGKPVAGEASLQNAVNVRLSRDGRLLAFERPGADRLGHLWVRELARGVETRVGEMTDVHASAFTRDGTRIGFVQAPGQVIVWRPVSGGTPAETLVAPSGTQLLIPHDWTDDGHLLYSALLTEQPGLFLLPPPGSSGATPRRLLDYGTGGGAALSPDGRWIALSRGGGAQRQVFLHPFPDMSAGRWAVSGPGGLFPRWRADGRELYFMDEERRIYAVNVRFDAQPVIGVPQVLFTPASLVIARGSYPYDVTPDGQRFILTRRLDTGAPPALVVALGWMR